MSIRSERKHRGDISLNEPIGVDRDGNEIAICDILGSDDNAVMDEVEKKLSAEKLKAIIYSKLTDRERQIILLRYGIDGGKPLPQREVGQLLNISRSYVSRIEKKAVGRLFDCLNTDDNTETDLF